MPKQNVSQHGNPLRYFRRADGVAEPFSNGGFTRSKEKATETARMLRNRGAKARVIKVKDGYEVWGRKD